MAEKTSIVTLTITDCPRGTKTQLELKCTHGGIEIARSLMCCAEGMRNDVLRKMEEKGATKKQLQEAFMHMTPSLVAEAHGATVEEAEAKLKTELANQESLSALAAFRTSLKNNMGHA